MQINTGIKYIFNYCFMTEGNRRFPYQMQNN